ncbi:MAG: rod shape-determining protein MreD [Brachymonas sp.]|nr:rod shape-determining protein MreD [Brachymonas sp.]
MILGKKTQHLLLPVDLRFLWLTLFVALLLNLLPSGRVLWMPDFLLVALAFWGLHQPRHAGVLVAFVFGLTMDVHRTTLLGMHALAYSAMAYITFLLHRRLQHFRPHWQALQMFGLFLGTHALLWLLRLATGGHWPGAGLLLAPVIEALLWPLLDMLLLAPQRRAPDRDLTRPL